MSQAKDYTYLIGTQYNKWTIHSIHRRLFGRTKKITVKATCVCGRTKFVLIDNLLNGHSKGCGCPTFPYKRKNCVITARRADRFDGVCVCGTQFVNKTTNQVNKGLCCFKPATKGVRNKYACLGLPRSILRPLHNRWRAFRRDARIYNIPMEPSWCDFKQWISDIGVPADISLWFSRKDIALGWVRGNCEWRVKPHGQKYTNA